MQRFTAYHGQVVTASDVDDWFDAVEDAERNTIIDGHDCQVLISDTPDPATYGGIVEGLTVSGAVAQDYVTVVAGTARDSLGRRINLSSGATVKITHTGVTPVGDITDAVGNAGAVTGACGTSKWIVASLYINFADYESDPKTDALGATIYYNLAESFTFEIQVGPSDFTHADIIAETDTPTRQALVNNKILLAEIILYNNAGTMELADVLVGGNPDILSSSVDWDELGGNYATLVGRRSSWLTIQTSEEFAEADADADFIRAGSAREALYDLGKKVRSQVFIAHRTETAPALYAKRGLYGHLHMPHEFFDDFFYQADQIDLTNDYMGPWELISNGTIGSPSNSYVAVSSSSGGAVSVVSEGNIGGRYMRINTRPIWNLGAAPFAIFSCRFWVPSALDTGIFAMRFWDVGSTEYALVYRDGSDIIGGCAGQTGVMGAPTTLSTLVIDTKYIARVVVLDSATVLMQINDGAWIPVPLSGADTFSSTRFILSIQVETTGAADGAVIIDQAHAADGQLIADMI
jgi:hypothetical protein